MRRAQDTASNRLTGGAAMGRLLRCALAACAVAWCYAAASAQTFYRWTDDRGVVHFADQPPAQAKGVEERHLAVPPAARQEPADAADQGQTAAGDSAAADAPQKPPAEGPAKVIVVARQTPRSGPSSRRVTGEVKNVGGKDAHQVVVSLSAVDISQGTLCLQSEAQVAPSTLRPGERGNFEINVDDPCLYDDTDVDINPVWE